MFIHCLGKSDLKAHDHTHALIKKFGAQLHLGHQINADCRLLNKKPDAYDRLFSLIEHAV